MTVLVVEDDEDIRQVVCTLLRSKGVNVIEATNGEDAVMSALRHHPDLIIMDVMMPVKTGFEALKEMRTDRRMDFFPVIMLTAVNDYELGLRRDAEAVGRELEIRSPEAFIEKPVDTAILLETITEVTGHPF